MATGMEYAVQAKKEKYDKLTYDQYDCQAFCELVLRDLGVRKPDGSIYNWKGSNDMYRHAVSWIGTVDECRRTFGEIPVGAWAFMWDTTGNEQKRGYYDGLGNASHIGIYIGNDQVRDSTKIKNASGKVTRDGVGTRPLKQFQKIGLPAMLDFGCTNHTIGSEVDRTNLSNLYTFLAAAVEMLKGWLENENRGDSGTS